MLFDVGNGASCNVGNGMLSVMGQCVALGCKAGSWGRELGNVEAARAEAEAVRVEAGSVELVRVEAAKVEAVGAELGKVEAAKAEAEAVWVEKLETWSL